MNASLAALEFERLKTLISRYTSTARARALLLQTAPSANLTELETEHALVAEAMAFLREQRVPFNEIPALEQALEKLSVSGSPLELAEIEAVQGFLGQVEGLRLRWKDLHEAFPELARKAARLPDLRELGKQLARAVHDGEIDERYSPQLARIRRAQETLRMRVTSRLESMLRNPDYANQIQDDVVTVRNGRFVIPVRTDQRKSLEGIVHGTSSSGATVFMEPLAVLEINNDLVRLAEEEIEEIARILAELTGLIQNDAPRIVPAWALCSELEVTFAKARFGRDFNCGRPVFSSGGLLSLIQARHPLLEDHLRAQGRSVHPVSLDLDRTRRILVISGPNAGGKTVVLKTVGLLALMAQSGMPVPADEATLPLFDQILADIGDQQSIANHLSTFSAHVLAIKSMLESVTPQSLVLLDEIGSSTEPGEGAALGKAVLERFREIGCLAVATTHYNRLKIYAETTPEVANAAMEFNERTLEPTYRLLHGLAGASSGLKIAERLQLPMTVLRNATAFLDSGEADVALYVEELRRRVTDMEEEKARLERERQDFQARKEREFADLQARHKEEISRAERQIRQIAKEMEDRAARELEAVQEESLKQKYRRKLDAVKAQAGAQLRREKEKIAGPPPPERTAQEEARAPLARKIEAGSRVRVFSLGVLGSVVAVYGEEAEVLVGNIRMRRPVEDLEPVEEKGLRLPPGVHVHVASRELESNEINLRGSTVAEAVERTDKFLDEAFLANLPQIRIVHGTGTGALRQAVTDLLKNHPHVASFEFAPQNQGGRGVTIAVLRG
jgi:DNA mismatch repair protein MutS2